MNTRYRLILGATLLFTLSLAGLAGCGGDDLECGERTIAEDGSCVPNTSEIRTCGEGTEVNADGECVLATGGCSTNTSFDSERGRCVPSSDTCGEGTDFDAESGTCIGVTGCGENTVQNDDGTCVPDVGTLCADQPGVQYNPDSGNCTVAAGSCGPGTQLSAQSGTCVISDAACDQGLTINDDGNCVPTDEVCGDQSTLAEVDGAQICVPSATCQEDDVVLMPAQSGQGVCVEPARALADNPDRTESEEPDNSSRANNDVDNNGVADPIVVKPVGETTAAVGTIGPPRDIDGDDEPEQDQDTFTFQGQAGQWFSVSLQSLGLPHGWFQVFGPNGFEREAQLGLQGNPARQIVLPYDGEYEIEVMPAEHAFDNSDDVGPAGDPSWGYVLGLEQLDAPDPTAVDFSSNTASGDLPTLTDNHYQVDGFSDGDLVEISLDSIESGAQDTAALTIWSADGNPLVSREVSTGGSVTFLYQTQNGNAPFVTVDWKYAVDPDLGYEISAEVNTDVENLGDVAVNDSASSTPRTISEDPEETYNYRVNVPGDQVTRITHTNSADEEAEFSVRRLGGSEIAFFNFYDPLADADNDEGYFYTEQSEELLISVTPDSSGDLTDFEMTVETTTPNSTVSNLQSGDTFLHEQNSSATSNTTEWNTFSVQDSVLLDGIVEKLQPANSTPDFEAVLYSAETGELESNDIFEVGNSGAVADITAEASGAERVLSPGKYLLGVRVEGTPLDRYRFDFDLTFAVAESEPNDTKSTASEAQLGAIGFGSLSSSADDDWYQADVNSAVGANEVLYFTAPWTGSGFFGPSGWNCEIHDSSGAISDPISHDGWNGCFSAVQGPLPAGTYWHLITNSTGGAPYGLEFNRVDGITEEEGNDSMSSANTLAFSDFQNGVDIFGDVTDGTDVFELTVSGSASQFSISTIQVGYDYAFAVPDVEIKDSGGNTLDSGSIGDTLDTGSLSGTAGAPIYIEVSNPGGFDAQYRISIDN